MPAIAAVTSGLEPGWSATRTRRSGPRWRPPSWCRTCCPPRELGVGQSNVAAGTMNIVLQIYKFGSTNAWTTLTTNSSCTAGADCTITGTATGTAGDYYED